MKFFGKILSGKTTKREEKNEKIDESIEKTRIEEGKIEDIKEREGRAVNRENRRYIDPRDVFKDNIGRPEGKKRELKIDIENRVSECLTELGISKSELARKLGVSKQYVNQISNSKTITVETAFAILQALGLEEKDIEKIFCIKKE
jgi:DNA-binding XRE family transcriptional regulator